MFLVKRENSMHKPICFYETLDIIPMMSSVCCLDHIAPTCTAAPLWFNSTSSNIKKLKASYNGGLRRLLLIVKPYSASEMFVTHGIPSFF